MSTPVNSLRGNWKTGGLFFVRDVGQCSTPLSTGQAHHKNWQLPLWLDKLINSPQTKQLLAQGVAEIAASDSPPDSLEDICNPSASQDNYCFERAQAYGYWQLLKDLWPAEKPLVVEAGCGPDFVLFENFPHEDLPGTWSAFDSAPRNVYTANKKSRLHNWPVRASVASVCHDPPVSDADIVIGQSLFGCVPELFGALTALKEKMKPGALLLHFQVSIPPVLNALPTQVDFPEQARQLVTDLTQTEFLSLFALQEGCKRKKIDYQSSSVIGFSAGLFSEYLDHFTFQSVDGSIISPVDDLQARLTYLLPRAGFALLASGVAQAAYLGPRLPHHLRLFGQELGGESGSQFIREHGYCSVSASFPPLEQFQAFLGTEPFPYNEVDPIFQKPDLVAFCRGQTPLALESTTVHYVVAQTS